MQQIERSSDADKTNGDRGWKTTPRTQLSWWGNVKRHCPVLVDQSLTVLSLDPDTKKCPIFEGFWPEVELSGALPLACGSFMGSAEEENWIPDSTKHFEMEASASADEKSIA
jgi:hypothetical protein